MIIKECKIAFNSTFVFGNTLFGQVGLLNVIVKGGTLSLGVKMIQQVSPVLQLLLVGFFGAGIDLAGGIT